MLSLFLLIALCFCNTTRELASVEGPHLLLCLKNSSNSIGQYVLSFEAAQYSNFQPASTNKVQNQRSSPEIFVVNIVENLTQPNIETLIESKN